MSLIEGIGDDFLYCVAFLLFIGIVSLAWLSTNVRQIPFPTTLFIIERRTHRRNEDESERLRPSSTPQPMISSSLSSSSSSHESDIETAEPEETNTNELRVNPIEVAQEQCDSTTIDSSDDQSLKFIIKFLNDTQKSISAHPNDTISKIKQLHFADDLSNNKIIRFIYQGRELQDTETLRTCNIRDQTIIHCQISARRHPAANRDDDGLRSGAHFNGNNNFDPTSLIDAPPINLSSHFVVLLTALLAFIWYLRIRYRLLFSPFSTIVLILSTIIFLIFTCGSFLTTRRSLNNPGSGTSISVTPIQHVHLD